MASKKNMQEDAMASVDTAKAMIDKVMSIMGLMLESPSLSLNLSTNPIGFLMVLLKHLGVTYEDLRGWLSNFLVMTIPVLELSVKTILLTNLKNMISCSVDPRIPEKYRKQHKQNGNYNTSQEYGIDINIESIDFLDKLSVSPLSDFGSEMYFGLDGVDDSYKFARAEDFDAFLWFVIHKGKFPSPTYLDPQKELMVAIRESIDALGASGVEGDSILGEVKVTFDPTDTRNTSSILMGNTFTYQGMSHIISMCFDRKYDTENNIVENTLLPISDDWTSVNWYIRRAEQLVGNIGLDDFFEYNLVSRNYSKERGICNLQYIDQASSDSPITGLVNNKLRFTILPKPYIHIPNVAKNEPAWRFKKMTFDANGNYDLNGKYTFAFDPEEEVSGDKILFKIPNILPNGGTVLARMGLKSGAVEVDNDNKSLLISNLKECYPGLTVFEFNYDYVMSLRLFDAKVMATTLLDSLIDMKMGIKIGAGTRHEEYTEKVKDILKSIIDTDDSEISDCFFSFDNSKYDALLRKSEEKRAKRQSFGNTGEPTSFDKLKSILDEYDNVTELHEKSDILHRAITQAAVTVSDGADEKDKYDIEYNFVFDLIENLVMAIVTGILSPKVLLLLEVNEEIMGGTWEKFTIEDLLKAMRGVIAGIIKEVKDLVIQELLKLVLEQLKPIKEMLTSILVREQLEDYADAIMEIVRNCPFIWFQFGNQLTESKLDTVDYADIEVSSNKEGESPSTNNC